MASNLMVVLISVVSLSALGSGCPDAAESGPARMPSIAGQLVYRERIALPPDTRAIVELRETSSADDPARTHYCRGGVPESAWRPHRQGHGPAGGHADPKQAEPNRQD